MNKFTERYKTLSNTDLLRIIENESDYQPEAFEAAMAVFNERGPSDQEISEAKKELEIERQKKREQYQKRIAVVQKVKSIVNSLIALINPIKQSTPTAEKLVKLITIIFAMITVIIWYNEFGLIKYILTNSLTGLDYSIVEYVLPILILPIATILFGLKKKSGWILLSTYISYSAINVIGILFLTWGMEPTGIPAIDSLFPQSLIISLIITALFYGGTLWVLNKREVREKFNTNQNTAIGTIALTVVLTIFLISHSTNFN